MSPSPDRVVPRRSSLFVARPLHALAALVTVSCVGLLAHAEPADPGGAREQLKLGFALKQANKCGEALPHFEESLRLDPATEKARLNMADCLESVGQLVRAAKEWATLRDRASSEPLKEEANKRLAAVEKRTPKLEIRLSGDPTDVLVRRDGIEMRGLSLNVPLPADPGSHTISAERPGSETGTQTITLAEGETKTVTIAPGKAKAAVVVAPAGSASAAVAPPPASAAPPPPPPPPAGLGTQKIAGIAVGGLGVVALGVATFAFVSASGKQDDAQSNCSARGCSPAAYPLHEDAKGLATIGNVSAIVGGVLVAGGATLFFTAKSPAATQTSLRAVASPTSLSLLGSF